MRFAMPSSASAIRSSNFCCATSTAFGKSKPGRWKRYFSNTILITKGVRNCDCHCRIRLRIARSCRREGPNSNKTPSAKALVLSKFPFDRLSKRIAALDGCLFLVRKRCRYKLRDQSQVLEINVLFIPPRACWGSRATSTQHNATFDVEAKYRDKTPRQLPRVAKVVNLVLILQIMQIVKSASYVESIG
jgi:hypothetical protein